MTKPSTTSRTYLRLVVLGVFILDISVLGTTNAWDRVEPGRGHRMPTQSTTPG